MSNRSLKATRLFRTLLMAVLLVAAACSGDDSDPSRPASTMEPTTSTTAVAVTARASTTVSEATSATTVPQSDAEPGASSLDLDNTEASQLDLSAVEQDCLDGVGIDPDQVEMAIDAAGPSPVLDAAIDCLEDDTALRLFLGFLLSATGELSDETSRCVRDGLGSVDLRRLMKASSATADPMESEMAGMTGFLVVATCLNDAEWNAAAFDLGLGPRDQAGMDCLLNELGGPAGVAEALLRSDATGGPMEFVTALEKCGVAWAVTSDTPPVDAFDDLPADTLSPIGVSGPEAFLSELSDQERSCIGEQGIGPLEIGHLTSGDASGSPETDLAIVNCLRDDTVLRLFLTTLVGQTEPLSAETSTCIREGFVPLDLRGMIAPGNAMGVPADAMVMSMAALGVSVACMNDAEWERHSSRLGMAPQDREGFACLMAELGGPGEVVAALRDASYDQPTPAFISAAETCGLEGLVPSR